MQGDEFGVLQADWDANGTMDHTMIVTKRSGNEIYLTYHSSDELDKAAQPHHP